MNEQIQRSIRRLLTALSRGRVTTIKDDGPVQLVQGRFNNLETVDQLPRMAEFGFTSHLPNGSDVLAIFVGGDRSNAAIVGSNHGPSRPKDLAAGETAVFNQVGIRIYLRNGGLVIEGAGLPLTVNNTPVVTVNASTEIDLNTPKLKVSGQIVAGGDITDNAGANNSTMATMRQIYDGHNHPVKNVQGGGSTITSDPPNQQI